MSEIIYSANSIRLVVLAVSAMLQASVTRWEDKFNRTSRTTCMRPTAKNHFRDFPAKQFISVIWEQIRTKSISHRANVLSLYRSEHTPL